MVYHISKVYLSLVYMQHRHMVYCEFHRNHYLVLDQNTSDNAYSALLRHEVWNVDQKMGNSGNWFVLEYILTYLCSTSELYWTWYFLSVHFLSMNIFLFLLWSKTSFLRCSFVRWCWNYWAKLTSSFWLPVCIFIC